jgi:hypothetical protein
MTNLGWTEAIPNSPAGDADLHHRCATTVSNFVARRLPAFTMVAISL